MNRKLLNDIRKAMSKRNLLSAIRMSKGELSKPKPSAKNKKIKSRKTLSKKHSKEDSKKDSKKDSKEDSKEDSKNLLEDNKKKKII